MLEIHEQERLLKLELEKQHRQPPKSAPAPSATSFSFSDSEVDLVEPKQMEVETPKRDSAIVSDSIPLLISHRRSRWSCGPCQCIVL
jgi:hypothetical protein